MKSMADSEAGTFALVRNPTLTLAPCPCSQACDHLLPCSGKTVLEYYQVRGFKTLRKVNVTRGDQPPAGATLVRCSTPQSRAESRGGPLHCNPYPPPSRYTPPAPSAHVAAFAPGATLKQPALVAKQHDRMDQTGCSADEAAAYVKGAATLPRSQPQPLP